jgi:hypothetical protein
MRLYEQPTHHGIYLEIAEINGKPVFVSPRVPQSEVAFRLEGAICMNDVAHKALKRNPEYPRMVEVICQNLLRHPLYHAEPTFTTEEARVIEYLRNEKVLV